MAPHHPFSITNAFHAGGEESFHTLQEESMWSARRTLRRRLEDRCQPVSLAGHLRILIARSRWGRRLRKRFIRPSALFLGSPAIFRIRCCSRGSCG